MRHAMQLATRMQATVASVAAIVAQSIANYAIR